MPRELSKCRKWEKERRERLNDAISQLSKLLPCYDPSINIGKTDVILKAVDVIKELQEKLKNLLIAPSNENKEEKKQDALERLQKRIKKLLIRNEQLFTLLKQAGINPPTVCGTVTKFKHPQLWSNKTTTEQAKILRKNEPEKENVTTKPKKKLVKRNPIKKAPAKKKPIVPITPPSKCVIVLSQPPPTQPCYIISTTTAPRTAPTNTTTVFSTTTPLISTLGPGTLILANGTIVPVLQNSTPTTVLPKQKKLRPKFCLNKTPPNKVAIPRIRRKRKNSILDNRAENSKTTKKDAAEKEKVAPVIKIIKDVPIPTATKPTAPTTTNKLNIVEPPQQVEHSKERLVAKPVVDEENNKKTGAAQDIAQEETMKNLDEEDDIFASLQVPSGCQNPESTSPTAAFLLAFPLVSSLNGVKVTEANEEEEDDEEENSENPTLLQIGTLSTPTKATQSETTCFNGINFDSFSFLSGAGGAANNAVTTSSTTQLVPKVTAKICDDFPNFNLNATPSNRKDNNFSNNYEISSVSSFNQNYYKNAKATPSSNNHGNYQLNKLEASSNHRLNYDLNKSDTVTTSSYFLSDSNELKPDNTNYFVNRKSEGSMAPPYHTISYFSSNNDHQHDYLQNKNNVANINNGSGNDTLRNYSEALLTPLAPHSTNYYKSDTVASSFTNNFFPSTTAPSTNTFLSPTTKTLLPLSGNSFLASTTAPSINSFFPMTTVPSTNTLFPPTTKTVSISSSANTCFQSTTASSTNGFFPTTTAPPTNNFFPPITKTVSISSSTNNCFQSTTAPPTNSFFSTTTAPSTNTFSSSAKTISLSSSTNSFFPSTAAPSTNNFFPSTTAPPTNTFFTPTTKTISISSSTNSYFPSTNNFFPPTTKTIPLPSVNAGNYYKTTNDNKKAEFYPTNKILQEKGDNRVNYYNTKNNIKADTNILTTNYFPPMVKTAVPPNTEDYYKNIKREAMTSAPPPSLKTVAPPLGNSLNYYKNSRVEPTGTPNYFSSEKPIVSTNSEFYSTKINVAPAPPIDNTINYYKTTNKNNDSIVLPPPTNFFPSTKNIEKTVVPPTGNYYKSTTSNEVVPSFNFCPKMTPSNDVSRNYFPMKNEFNEVPLSSGNFYTNGKSVAPQNYIAKTSSNNYLKNQNYFTNNKSSYVDSVTSSSSYSTNLKKQTSTTKAPINWMMTPTTSDFLPPPPPPVTSDFVANYFNTNSDCLNLNKSEDFVWNSTKLAPPPPPPPTFLEPPPPFVSSTLPTLVGDLALNTNFNDKNNQQRCYINNNNNNNKNLRLGYENNIFSVSQMVEPSTSTTKKGTNKNHHRSGATKKLPPVKKTKNNYDGKINYSAEALIGQPELNKRQLPPTQHHPPHTSFLSSNEMPFFPVELDGFQNNYYIHDNNPLDYDNLNLFGGTSGTANKKKLPKKKALNVAGGDLGSFELPLFGVGAPPSAAAAASPLLPEDFHPNLLPAPPYTSGTSLTNFNLSTIFPEINNKVPPFSDNMNKQPKFNFNTYSNNVTNNGNNQ